MQLATIQNDVITIVSHTDAFPNTSFPPSGPPPSFIEENGCYEVRGYREYNPATHKMETTSPYLEGGIVYTVAVVPLSTAELEAAVAREVAQKVEALWRAADAYTSSFISGVAIGILTIGVLQQKPKALAVTQWSSQIWGEYYQRKALITATSEDNHDFSSFGPIPFSVPELQAELGM